MSLFFCIHIYTSIYTPSRLFLSNPTQPNLRVRAIALRGVYESRIYWYVASWVVVAVNHCDGPILDIVQVNATLMHVMCVVVEQVFT